MSIKTEFILEMRKLRRRHIPLLFLMIFALITAWTCWCMDDLDITRLNDASAMLFTNLLLMNTILCPIVLAALASRMCDMEQMGNTYKWICTMQKPEHVYRGKAAAGSFYIILFALMQTLLFRAVSRSQVHQPADANLHKHRRHIYRAVLLVFKQMAAALSDTVGILCIAVQCGIYI